MSVTTSYPGLYIQELPSSVHTITAAPTSITVFVGYTHPFKTTPQFFNQAIEVDDFTSFENAFGGLFASDSIPLDLPYAVQQFFLNGGAQAYIVALPPGGAANPLAPPTATLGQIVFTGREPVDPSHALTVTVSNISPDVAQSTASVPIASTDTSVADLTVTYGTSQAETYRKVSLNPTVPGSTAGQTKPNPNYIETRINGVSSLVSVSPAGGASAGANFSYGQYPAATSTVLSNPTSATPAAAVFNPPDFNAVFQVDTSLDKVPIFNILVVPGVSDFGVLSEAVAFCERKRAFLIVDPPINDVADPLVDPTATLIEDELFPSSTNAAVYFPYVESFDSAGAPVPLAPSGFVAGIYSKIDSSRGVWKAPAGLETTLTNASGVVPSGKVTDTRAGILNNAGVNCIRTFANLPPVVFGARTLASTNPAFQQWKYVPVRRMALFLEQTLLANLGWVVFEPNDEPLWLAITSSITAFMLTLFHQGAFQGQKTTDAFLVKCDSSTTTQTDIDNGRVNILVGFAPLKPAEFVVIQITQLAGQSQS